jgi:hypothetical protein
MIKLRMILFFYCIVPLTNYMKEKSLLEKENGMEECSYEKI